MNFQEANENYKKAAHAAADAMLRYSEILLNENIPLSERQSQAEPYGKLAVKKKEEAEAWGKKVEELRLQD